MKIINIKDLNRKILYLDRGEYLINGKRYSFENYHDNKIEIEDLKELKKINITTVVIHYYDEVNQKEISVKEYENQKEKLLSKGYRDEDCNICFDDLDDEYNYKRFIKNNKAIYKTIETISDNIKLPEEKVIYKTKNKYIESCYFNEKDEEPKVYRYDRQRAYIDIVENKFNQLGFEFAGDCTRDQTNEGKIWGNSTSSGIIYVKAFGSYIFDDTFKLRSSSIKGTLEDLLNTYEKDKHLIESTIMRKYNEKFAKINKDKLSNLPGLVNELQYQFNKINPKKDSYANYRKCDETLVEIQKIISESFE